MSMFRSGGMRSVSKQIAHTTILPLGNKDLRLLQDLITTEKMVVSDLTKLADDLAKASEALKQWGLGEGEDLGDILSASREILICVSSALSQFGGHEASIRVHMKAVRTREENLDAMRKARKSVGSKAEGAEKKLSKMGSEHKQLAMQTDLLNKLRDEMRQLDADIMVEEARISDYKRQTTKDWMALKFGGLLELAQKVVLVGSYGKEMIEEIPLDLTTPGYGRVPYAGHDQAERLLADATHAIGQVVFQPTTGNLAYHYEPGSQMAPPPSQRPLSHSETPAQSIARQQGAYGGLGHGLPPQPEPHAAYPGLPQSPAPQLDHPRFDRSFSSSMMTTSTNNESAYEFGQFPTPPPMPQSQTLGVGGGGGGPYPPRTSSVKPEDNSNSRFATFPNHGRPPPPNVGVAAPTPSGSIIYSSAPNPAFNPQRSQNETAGPPSPAVPPKDGNPWTQPNRAEPPAPLATERQRPASGSSYVPPPAAFVEGPPRASHDQSRFSVDTVQDLELDFGQNDGDAEDRRHSQSTSRPPVRKAFSGISDGGADMVLAYYHNEEDEGATPVAETTPIPSIGPAGGHGNIMNRSGEGAGDDLEGEDPYAADAFENGTPSTTRSYTGPHQPQLDLPPTEPLRPRSVKGADDVRAANVAAAREVGRELDALTSTSAAPPSTTMIGPPPRLSSKSALRPQPLGPPYSSPSVPEEVPRSTPPHLSLRFTDTSFDFPGMSSPTSPEVKERLHSLNPGTSPDVPSSPRARSPPPSFEVATSATQTPPTFSSTRSIPTAVFDPNVIPGATQNKPTSPPPSSSTSNSLAVGGQGPISRSSSVVSGTSGESALSSLVPPHPPYAASSPSRGTTTLMPLPTTPGGSRGFSQDTASPKTISAGAFKKFRAGDSPARSGTSDTFPGRKQTIPPMDTHPSYTSAVSGNSKYTSAPSSPVRERSSSEVYQPSPLSIPMGARQMGGDHEVSGSYRDTMLSSGGYGGGNHSPIGLAVGSPTNSNVPEGWTSSPGKNRQTIGDAGWQSRSVRNGSLPDGGNVDEGGENRDSGRTGGYGSGNYTTLLE